MHTHTYVWICAPIHLERLEEDVQCPVKSLSVILRQNLSLNLEECTRAYINFKLYV